MAERALPLDEELPLELPSNPLFDRPEEENGRGSNAWGALKAGAYGVVASGAGGIQYLTGGEEDSGAAVARRYGTAGREAAVESMDEGGKRAFNASILPEEGTGNDIWDKDVDIWQALGLKATSGAASIATSIMSGYLAAQVGAAAGLGAVGAGALATTVGGAVGGLQSGGDVFNNIQQGILDMPDEKLREESPYYEAQRDKGLSEEEAKRKTIERAVDVKPLLMAGITAITSKYGAEGLLSKSMRGEAVNGVLRRGGTAFVGEGAQEFTEEGSGEVLSQAGAADAKDDDLDVDWWKALEAGAQGFVAGAPTGGAVSVVMGNRKEASPVAGIDPDALAALTPPADPVTPEVKPPGVNATVTALLNGTKPGATVTIDNGIPPEVAAVAAAREGNELGDDPDEGVTPEAQQTPNVPPVQAQPLDPVQNQILNPPPSAPAMPPSTVPAADVAAAPVTGPVSPEPAPEVMETITPEVAVGTTQPVAAPEVIEPVTAPEPVQAQVAPEVQSPTPVPEPAPVDEPAPVIATRRTDGRRVLTDWAGEERDARVKTVQTYLQDRANRKNAPAAPEAQRAGPRMSAAEAQRIVRGEAEPATMTLDRTKFYTEADRTRINDTLKLLKQRDAPLPDMWREIDGLRGAKLRGPSGPANKARWLELREEIAKQQEAYVADPEAPARRKKDADKVARAAKEQADAKAVQEFINSTPYSEAQRRGDKAAMKGYILTLLEQMKAREVTIPKKATTDGDEDALTPAELLHLRAAQGLRNTEDKARLADFMANDFALRNGDVDVVRETYRSQQLKAQGTTLVEDRGPKVGKNEAEEEAVAGIDQGPDAERDSEIATKDDEGTDAAELYDRDTADPEVTAPEGGEPSGDGMTEGPEEEYADVAVRDRAPVKLKGHVAIAGKDKAGKFQAEVKKRRAVTLPGKSAAKPAIVTKIADLKAATAHVPQPTAAQAIAGNAPKGHIVLRGMRITVETPAGAIREDKNNNPPRWRVKLKHAYGELRGTMGADGDPIDVYIGPKIDSPLVWIVDQVDADTQAFDEHKALIGFESEADAIEAYRGGFSDGRADERMGGVTGMSIGQFREWVRNPQRKAIAPSSIGTKVKLQAAVEQKAKTPQTEAKAAEGLAEMRVAENEDVLAPNGKSYSPREVELLAGVGDDIEREMRAAGMWNEEPKRLSVDPSDLGVLEYYFKRAEERAQQPRTNIETNVRDLLTDRSLNHLTGLNHAIMGTALDRVRQLAGGVPVRIVDLATMMELYADEMIRKGSSYVPQGYYDHGTDEIVLREDAMQDPDAGTALALHEAVHAAYSNALERRPNVKKFIRGLLETAYRRLEALNPDAAIPYGFTDEHEFLAEALSNPAFQQFLADTPVRASDVMRSKGILGKIGSVWDLLLNSIKETLGLPNHSVLAYTLRAVQQLDMAAQTEANGGTMPKLARFEDMADRRTGASTRMRKFGLVTRTLHQISQRYRGLFQTAKGDGIERVFVALKQADHEAKQAREEGLKWAGRFMEIKERDRAEAAKAASFMIDVTMTGVNVLDKGGATDVELVAANPHLGKDAAKDFQAKARLRSLQDRFMALQPDTRRFILESAKYYRDTQNTLTRATVGNILDTLETPLDPKARAAMIERTVTDRLGEDEEKIIANDAVFATLKQAQGLRVVKGLYFPLMRHGDWVVRATEKEGDLYGGTLSADDPNVVEFTSTDDAKARKMLKQFAEKTDLDVTSVGKVRRLTSTGKIVSMADATGQDHEVIYRARVMRQGTYFFDTPTDAAKFIRENRGTFAQIDQKPLEREHLEQNGDLTNQQFKALISSIERRSDIEEGTKNLLRSTMTQASVRLMSGNRIQHRSQARRGVYGASEDIARNTVQYAEASSRYLGKIRHMPEIREALTDMHKIVKDEPYGADMQARNMVLNELHKRIDQNVLNPSEPSKIVGDIMALSFLDKLFSPAYSIINGMQVAMVTGPILGGTYGNMRAGHEITRAYNTIGAGGAAVAGVVNTVKATRRIARATLDTGDLIGSIRKNLEKASDASRLTSLFDTIVGMDIIDPGSGLEIAAAVASGRGKWGTGLSKVDRIARQLPMAVEAINRSVTAVAAYRLHYASTENHAESVRAAIDAIQNTQGDYSAVNAPAFFNNPWLRPALQFKKYAQMLSALMVDMVQRANFSTPEGRQALKQIGNLLTVQVAMAGALSLPGLELVKIVAMVAGALGIGEGYDDIERKVQDAAKAAVGQTWGELLTRGVIPRALGIDLSTRLSLADMWTFGEPKSNDREGLAAYMTQFIAGAPGSLALDWASGLQDAASGDFVKAATKLIPNKLISDMTKAGSGYANRDLTAAEAVVQAIGVRPKRLAQESEETGRRIDQTKQRDERAKELRNAYLNATTRGELIKLKAQIKQHNEAQGTTLKQKVFVKSLDNIRAAKEKKRDELRG